MSKPTFPHTIPTLTPIRTKWVWWQMQEFALSHWSGAMCNYGWSRKRRNQWSIKLETGESLLMVLRVMCNCLSCSLTLVNSAFESEVADRQTDMRTDAADRNNLSGHSYVNQEREVIALERRHMYHRGHNNRPESSKTTVKWQAITCK